MEALSNTHIDEVNLLRLHNMHAPLKCHLVFARATHKTSQPNPMGSSSVKEEANLQRVMSQRFFGVIYRNGLNPKESLAAQLPDDDFKSWYSAKKKENKHIGTSFYSPFGMPLVRMCDFQFFERPTCYNFYFDLEPTLSEYGPEVYDTSVVQDFKPCFYGDRYLKQHPKAKLAYGRGTIDGINYMFISKKRTKIKIVNDPSVPCLEVKLGGETYICANQADMTPVPLESIRSDVEPFLSGVQGDKEAILNYGGYIRSSHPSGFACYQTLFAKRRCELPSTTLNSFPQYPYFPKNAVTIKRANKVKLTGSASIAFLKLLPQDEPDIKLVHIDLNGPKPKEIVEVEYPTMEFEFE